MAIEFKWTNDERPKTRTVEDVQQSLQFALDHFPDPQGLRELVATAHIKLNEFGDVVGVGWSKDDAKRLVVFTYTPNGGKTTCVYYESPK